MLEGMRCQDCLYPPQSSLSQYDASRLANKKKELGINIDDITLTSAVAQNTDFFYCVAGVTDHEVMKWYPLQTSLFCPGKFCGSTIARYDEMVESIYRLLSPNIFPTYTADRQAITQRVSASGIQLSVPELATLATAKKRCNTGPCVLEHPEELDLYMLYCAWQADRCGLPAYRDYGSVILKQVKLAVLVQANIIPEVDAHRFQPNSFVPWSVLQSYVPAVQHGLACTPETDYDADGVPNERDNCPYTYNPNQRNTDADTLGDVCDDDIDGDGVSNAVGVVDDAGNLIPELLKQSKDNCLFVANENQKNADTDGFGDRCDPDTPDLQSALMIQATPQIGQAPTNVVFTATTLGNIQKLAREFGDWFFATTSGPAHTFTEPGQRDVVAQATPAMGHPVVSRLPITIAPPAAWSVWCAAVISPLRSTVPATISLRHVYTGALQKITRQDTQAILGTVNPGETLEQTMTQPGRYLLEMQCYDDQANRAGLSQATVELVADDDIPSVAAYLKASALLVPVGEKIQLQTVKWWFGEEDVDHVVWEFGDGDTVTTAGMTIEKIYLQPATYLIGQTIFFKDQRPPLYQALTVSVGTDKPLSATVLTAATLSGAVWDPLSFTIHPINVPLDAIRYIVRECADAQPVWAGTNIATWMKHICAFATAGSQRVRATVYTDDNALFVNELTVYIQGGDRCPDDAPDILCDLDTDTQADRCDSDIDGDKIPQWMGLVIHETPTCPFDATTLDVPRVEEYHRYVRKTGSGDNCPFVANPEQIDADHDGYGSGCDINDTDSNQPKNGGGNWDGGGNGDWDGDGDWDGNWWASDRDGDGLPDTQDGCPWLPEQKNGTEDDDGCPELPPVDPKKNERNPFIKAGKCTQCPCPYADYASALRKGDRVRALLLDPAGSIIYQYSQAELIKKDIGKILEGKK